MSLKKISPEEIINCYEKTERFIESLEDAHERYFERITGVQLSEQPSVMKYVVEVLMETPEEEDPVILTEDDVGCLFLLLKTVIDLLDKTAISSLKKS